LEPKVRSQFDLNERANQNKKEKTLPKNTYFGLRLNAEKLIEKSLFLAFALGLSQKEHPCAQ